MTAEFGAVGIVNIMFRMIFSDFKKLVRGDLPLGEAWGWFAGGCVLLYALSLFTWNRVHHHYGEKLNKLSDSFDIDTWYFYYHGGLYSDVVILIWACIAMFAVVRTNWRVQDWHTGNFLTLISAIAWFIFVPFALFGIGFSLLLTPWGK